MKVKEKKRLIILDTHAILHRAYHALPDFSSSKGEPTGALYGLVSMLTKIITDLKPDYIIATLDLPSPTYRHIAFADYKAHRIATDGDLVSQIIRSRDVLDAFAIPRYECEGFEADDVIGTIVEEMKGNNDIDLIIASGDMDTLQLVDDERVRVYTLKKGINDTILYDEKAVVARFDFVPALIPDYKGLRGDQSDNIPGVKGVGEKTAQILISKFGTLEEVYKVLKNYPDNARAVGLKEGMLKKLLEQEEGAEFSKMLATIRRDAPIDFVLPEKEWRESIDHDTLFNMLAEFDFRTLMPRVEKLFGNSGTQVGQPPQQTRGEKSGLAGQGDPRTFRKEFAEEVASLAILIPDDEFEKVAIATWVLDSNITQPTLDDVYRIGNSTDFTEAKEYILKEIKSRDLLFVYEKIELPLTSILRQMEQYGVRVDATFLQKLSIEYHAQLNVLSQKIYAAAEGEFNINSPKQLGEVLFDRLGLGIKNQKKTASGTRSTRESELQKMRDSHPIIVDILAHRELQKLLSTYIDSIPTQLDENSRLHTSFIQTGTTTGRLASQNPNLQNIPIKTELGRAIRHAFVADEGMVLLSFDYSQIELRVAALLSGDEGLIEIFKGEGDIHTEVATRVFHVAPEEVTYEQRRRAKVINFGILYGMGVNALRESLGTTRKEAQEFYNQYFEAFPRLAEYIDEVKADVARLGYTETFFGRRRYFEGINSPIPYIRSSAERMAVNAPLQGTSADILKLAMIAIDEMFMKEKMHEDIRMLMQVHDELVFEVTEGEVERIAIRIKEIMEDCIADNESRGIPFLVEGKVGTNWGNMKKI